LPGPDAQYMMAPVKRARIKIENLKEGEYKRSAVILLLCRDERDEIYIPLTERFAYDGVHSGQVSLPGGKSDHEENHFETALRECAEEIGVEPTGVQLLGELTGLYIPVSGFLVKPVIGFCTAREPELRKNPREVKTIVRLSLASLMNENLVKEGSITAGDQKIKAPYFLVEGLKVWGATAMILSEFKTVLKTIF
jgi:8-oxo-dGTP pyrophosphatase MutT (NUDIX family)